MAIIVSSQWTKLFPIACGKLYNKLKKRHLLGTRKVTCTGVPKSCHAPEAR